MINFLKNVLGDKIRELLVTEEKENITFNDVTRFCIMLDNRWLAFQHGKTTVIIPTGTFNHSVQMPSKIQNTSKAPYQGHPTNSNYGYPSRTPMELDATRRHSEEVKKYRLDNNICS